MTTGSPHTGTAPGHRALEHSMAGPQGPAEQHGTWRQLLDLTHCTKHGNGPGTTLQEGCSPSPTKAKGPAGLVSASRGSGSTPSTEGALEREAGFAGYLLCAAPGPVAAAGGTPFPSGSRRCSGQHGGSQLSPVPDPGRRGCTQVGLLGWLAGVFDGTFLFSKSCRISGGKAWTFFWTQGRQNLLQ